MVEVVVGRVRAVAAGTKAVAVVVAMVAAATVAAGSIPSKQTIPTNRSHLKTSDVPLYVNRTGCCLNVGHRMSGSILHTAIAQGTRSPQVFGVSPPYQIRSHPPLEHHSNTSSRSSDRGDPWGSGPTGIAER